MNKTIAAVVGLLLLLLLLLFSTTFTVRYNEVAIKATFGDADESGIVTEPGLHFRLPVFIDKVTKLDTRLQLVESPMEEIETRDGLQVVVRAYLLWRVDRNGSGPLDFFKQNKTIDNANDLLRGRFRTAFTGALSGYAFEELIGEKSRLADAESAIQAQLAGALAGQGIEPVGVGISQIVLPPKTSTAVLARMETTRSELVSAQNVAGTAEAARIRGQANTAFDKIRAFAQQRADEIRALGEERAARYRQEMAEDEELAIFLVWLDTLEQALNRNTTVILPTELAPFHLLGIGDIAASDGIPQPKDAGAADDLNEDEAP